MPYSMIVRTMPQVQATVLGVMTEKYSQYFNEGVNYFYEAVFSKSIIDNWVVLTRPEKG